MTMMENATTSIELGVEDFVNDDPRRLTSAMRNVAAGILLLLKCVLEDRSPAGTNGVLIYMNIEEAVLPNGAVVLTAKGKKTVDVAGIKSRFKDLGIAMNWKALDTIISISFSTDDGHCLLSCRADADDIECAVCGARPESDDFYPESGMCGGCHWSYQKLLEE